MANSSNDKALAAAAASYAYMHWLQKPFSNAMKARLPAGVTQCDFNFLSPNSKLATTDIVLISSGQYQNKSNYLRPNQMPGVTVIGDSGGYQIKNNPQYYRGLQTATAALSWQEQHCDVAPILDIPTDVISHKDSPWKDVSGCLATTIDNAEVALKQRSSSSMLLLNVIQGSTPEEFREWYHGVKHLELDGWAIGGKRKLDFACLIWLLFQLRKDGLLERTKWMHIFGTFRLEMALGLTALKKLLDKVAGRSIPVTYDASTPFTAAYENFEIYVSQQHVGDRLPMQMEILPTDKKFARSNEPFPAAGSSVSDLFTLGQICINAGPYAKTYGWDELSRMAAANHNLDFVLNKLDELHAIFNQPADTAREHIPDWILDLESQGREILKARDPERLLRQRASKLSVLCGGKYY